MDFSVRHESEITDKGNLDKSKIMDIESTENGANNDAGALDATEIVDNGATYEIVHSADRDMYISVVIHSYSVPENHLSQLSWIMLRQRSQMS